LAEGAALDFEPVAITGDDTLFFQYTGGTTGLSKGADVAGLGLLGNDRLPPLALSALLLGIAVRLSRRTPRSVRPALAY